MAKNLKCENRTVRITEKLFVKNDSAYGKILVCDNCTYINSKNEMCKCCYGRLAMLETDVYDAKKGDFVKKKEVFRDKFTIEKSGRISAQLGASDLIESSDVMAITDSDKRDDIGSGNLPWVYTDRPLTFKTDCLDCKAKFGEETPCKNVEKNIENNKPAHFCSEQKARTLKFY